MKPIIGINLDVQAGPPPEVSLQVPYFESIQKAGGIPVLLPPMPDDDLQEVLGRLNGVVLIGGLDYCPSLYGETANHTVEVIDPRRQDFDLRLANRVLSFENLPLLGICGGCQLLNISLGGSLIQDIKTELPESHVAHTKPNGWREGFARHDIRLSEKSELLRIYQKEQISVPTSHHQAVKVLGQGLSPVAYAEDGIIEALELTSRRFTIGVQWHPERDYDSNKPLFEEFVRQSAQIPAGRP